MSCPKTKLISAYLDEELQDSDRDMLEAHVQGCAQCGTTLRDTRSLRAAFANTERYQSPYGFTTRVIARAELEQKKSPWFVPLFIGFAEAAVLLFVITAGIFAGKVMTDSPSRLSKTANVASSLSLEVFDATPPGSLGGAYLAMTEAGNEK